MIRLEMLEKGKIRARNQTETGGKIIRDLEKDYLTTENFKSVN